MISEPLPTKTPPGCGSAWRALAWLCLPAVAALALCFDALAGSPRIYLIEPFVENQVLIHFDTEPNRTYVLQYTSSLSATSRWSNLYTAFAFPFPNHFIVTDTRSAPQRFYRLSVTPDSYWHAYGGCS